MENKKDFYYIAFTFFIMGATGLYAFILSQESTSSFGWLAMGIYLISFFLAFIFAQKWAKIEPKVPQLDRIEKRLNSVITLPKSEKQTKKDTFDDEFLKLEYDCAQRSAEHHCNQSWVVASIFSIAEATLILAFVAAEKAFFQARPFLALIGIFGALFVVYVIGKSIDLKKQKYDFCKEIEEKILGKYGARALGQHTRLCYSPGTGSWLKIWFLSLAGLWVVLLVFLL